jgi:hypothetical protein
MYSQGAIQKGCMCVKNIIVIDWKWLEKIARRIHNATDPIGASASSSADATGDSSQPLAE